MFEPRNPNPDLRISLGIASMDKYKRQQQHESNFRRSRPVDEDRRRTKVRKEKETTEINSSSRFSPLFKQPPPHGEIAGGSRGRSPRTGFDPQTDGTVCKTFVRRSSLPSRGPVNENKAVNWRLACFLAHEYLTRRTLLGKQWPPQDSNPKCGHGNNEKSKPKAASLDKADDETRREKERIYYTLADFLGTGDVHLPGIVNPSQLASWVGLD